MGLKKRGAKRKGFKTIARKRAYERDYYREVYKEKRGVQNKRRYWELKVKWLEIFKERGLMKCGRCGYDKCFDAIEFHHPDPSKKERVAWIYMMTINDKNLLLLDDIIPLCANCHREVHYEQRVSKNPGSFQTQ